MKVKDATYEYGHTNLAHQTKYYHDVIHMFLDNAGYVYYKNHQVEHFDGDLWDLQTKKYVKQLAVASLSLESKSGKNWSPELWDVIDEVHRLYPNREKEIKNKLNIN